MLLIGNCIDEMKKLNADSIDAIVTDPPYGLEFMGKEWDKLEPARNNQRWIRIQPHVYAALNILIW